MSGLWVGVMPGGLNGRPLHKTGWFYSDIYQEDGSNTWCTDVYDKRVSNVYPQEMFCHLDAFPKWSIFMNFSPRDTLDWVAFHYGMAGDLTFMLAGRKQLLRYTRREIVELTHGLFEELMQSCKDSSCCSYRELVLPHVCNWKVYQTVNWINITYRTSGDITWEKDKWLVHLADLSGCIFRSHTIHPFRYIELGFYTASMDECFIQLGFEGFQPNQYDLCMSQIAPVLEGLRLETGGILIKGVQSRAEIALSAVGTAADNSSTSALPMTK
jgi:hypothetical protein